MPYRARPTVLLAAIAVGALLACGGETPATEKNATAVTPGPDTGAVSRPLAVGNVAGGTVGNAAGAAAFTRCVVCHQADGGGLPNAFPPLAGSEWVNGSADRVLAAVMHGVTGPITVKGTAFNSAMMPYGTGVPMTDQELADVVTYVRASWGNRGSAVTPADVERVRRTTASRTTPYTATELQAMP